MAAMMPFICIHMNINLLTETQAATKSNLHLIHVFNIRFVVVVVVVVVFPMPDFSPRVEILWVWVWVNNFNFSMRRTDRNLSIAVVAWTALLIYAYTILCFSTGNLPNAKVNTRNKTKSFRIYENWDKQNLCACIHAAFKCGNSKLNLFFSFSIFFLHHNRQFTKITVNSSILFQLHDVRFTRHHRTFETFIKR